MSDFGTYDYARERYEAEQDEPYRARLIAGTRVHENDVPDEEEL